MNEAELDELVLAGLSDRCAFAVAAGLIVATDKRFKSLFGWDSEPAQGSLPLADLIAQVGDLERHKAQLLAAHDQSGSFVSTQELIVWPPQNLSPPVAGQEPIRRELQGWLRRADGTIFWGLLQYLDRGADKLLCQVLDLSEKRSQADAYKILRRRFGAVFDQTYQFTGLLDAQGNLLEVNETALKFAGHTTEEVIGRPFWEARWWAVSPVTQEKLKAAINEARKGKLVRDTVQNLGADEKTIYLDFSIKPVKDDEGNVVMLIPEGREITDRVMAEMELRQKTLELEEANRLLRDSERLKSEFFANVSHELRTPLTLLLAPLDSLLSEEYGAISNEQRPLLQIIHNNAARLLQMINGLLDFSKLEASKVSVQRQATDVLTLVRGLMGDFEPVMAGRKLACSLHFDEQSLWLSIDRYLFERIFFNLLANAVKFTADGGSIKISLQWQNDELTLAVQDTGIGIAEADLANLFQKFRQLEGSSVRRYEGTGLGLALAREFAELMGGTITVASKPQQGSTFTVKIKAPACQSAAGERESDENIEADLSVRPRGRADIARHFPVSLTGVADGIGPQWQGSEPVVDRGAEQLPEILVAEDNAELAQYIKLLLNDICRVCHVGDGLEALAKLQDWKPSLVLSDVMMPNMDGLALCAAIKADEKLQMVPVILLTALTHREALLKGWQAGADDYLFKPFHPTELKARVQASLKNYRVLSALNDELVKSRDEALKAYKFKSDFLSHMSHEIRTPMNAVIGMSDLLSRTVLNEDQVKLLSDIQYSADLLLELINDILDYSKIESGRVELEQVPFDLRGLVEGCAMLLASRASQKGISLTTSFEVMVPPVVVGDPARIRQVLLNLLANAVKFTDKGAVSVATTVDTAENGRATLRFTVSDTGIGMSGATLQNLFQPFVQGDSTITRRFGGTGLGLAICHGLVERMGGHIGASSRVAADINCGAVEIGEASGSTFWFTVPVALSDKGTAAEQPGESAHTYAVARTADDLIARSGAFTSKQSPPLRQEKILVAEDNLMNQTLIVLQLQELGFEARAVMDGAEAVEAFATGDYAAILMDCQMPGLDGMAATEAIRALEASRRVNGLGVPRVPVIAVTAHAMPSDRELCLKSGMDDFLPKPITLKDLRDVLARWVPLKVEVHEK